MKVSRDDLALTAFIVTVAAVYIALLYGYSCGIIWIIRFETRLMNFNFF